jgi:prepilin-type N-terminal cleavage/methylation domain-containing protein
MKRAGLTLIEVLIALASLAVLAPLVAGSTILARSIVARADARLAALPDVDLHRADLLERCDPP